MSQNLGQEPAFPFEENDELDGHYNHLGMSKRFYVACAAMQGLLSSGRMTGHKIDELISNSYEIADELLKQENK